MEERSDLASSIKAGDNGPARISILRGLVTGRNVLVTAQLALSVVLLVISADCIRGFQAAWRIDPGFRVDHTLFFSLDPNIQRYGEAKTRDFYKKLTDRLRESGGVNPVSMSSSIPFSTGQTTRKYLAEGAQPRTSGDTPSAFSYKVDDHFFPLMETKIDAPLPDVFRVESPSLRPARFDLVTEAIRYSTGGDLGHRRETFVTVA